MVWRNRWVVLAIVSAVVLGAVFLTVQVRLDSGPDHSQTSPGAGPPAPDPDALDPDRRSEPEASEAEPAGDPGETTTSAAAFGVREEARSARGPGRIYGHVEAPGSDALPAGTVVSLHRVDMDAAIVEYDDTLVGAAEPGADRGFEFARLPFGQYSVFATAPGYTIQSSTELNPQQHERELTLRLVPGGTISGRVVNESRESVEGAHVFTAAWDIMGQNRFGARDRVLSSRVVTGADGSFTMEHLRQSTAGEPGYRLAVKAEGYATFLSGYMPAGTQGVEFVLARGGVVVGQLIHYRSREPVPDKSVKVQSELTVERLVARSDVDGWFFLNDVPAGTHRIELIDEELVLVPETADIIVAESGSTDDLTVQVAPGGRLSGRVYDSESGIGIAGARLDVQAESDSSGGKQAVTDADGEYQFKGLKPGSYRLSLAAKVEGYPEARRPEDNMRMTSAAIDSETTGIDFALSRGIVISGRVVDESGEPVAEAAVNAQADRANTSDYARTDEAGGFLVAGFEPNQLVYVDADKEGYALLDAQPERGAVQLEDRDYSGVRLVLGSSASISGTVVDKLGRPKPGVQMFARSPTQVNRGSQIYRSAADGAIRFESLGPGEYKLVFSDLPYQFGQDNARTVKVGKGQHVTGVKIVYPEAEGLTITGRVTNEEGRPVANATVRMSGAGWQDASTNPNGEYTLIGLNEGNYTLFAASFQYSSSESVTVEAGARNVNFVLKGLASIEGRVVSRGTGRPVTAFRARVQSEQQSRYYVRDEWVTVRDAEGRFRLSGIEAGPVSIEVRAEDYAETVHPAGTVAGGETIEDVVIRLDGGARLTGRVLDSQGNGVSAAKLFIGEVPNGDWMMDREKRAVSGPDGTYEMVSLPAGSVRVSVFHSRFAPRSVDLNVTPAITNRADIVMSNGGMVTGVLTLDGSPMPQQSVHVSAPNGTPQSANTDESGRYEIGGLPDGRIHINPTLQAPGVPFRGKTAYAEVTDGVVIEMDFDFVTGTSSVEGIVYDASDRPVGPLMRVSLHVETGDGVTDYMYSQTDPSGYYQFESVPAGQARLRAWRDSGAQTEAIVAIGERDRIRQDLRLE